MFRDQLFHIVEKLDNKFKLVVAYNLYTYTHIYVLSLGSGLKKQTHKQPVKYPNKKRHLPI